MKQSNIITVQTMTREQARNFVRKAKACGVDNLTTPVKMYGVWWVENKKRPVLTLNKGV
jgi:hypothetical protein